MFDHVFLACKAANLLECYSDNPNYDYYIRLENTEDIPKAMELIEKELSIWGGGYVNINDKDLFNYYHYSGYVEVVENILKTHQIDVVEFYYDDEAEFITKLLFENVYLKGN